MVTSWSKRVGEQLLVVGELAVDEARGDPDVAGRVAELEDGLVLADGDLDVARAQGGGQARDLAERLDRDDGLDLGLERVVELRLLDGQPVAVGGDHLERVADDGHEHTGEDRPRLVARSGAADLVQRLDERLAADREGAGHVEGGRLREVGRRPGVEREGGAPGADLDRRLAGLDDDLFVGQVADDVAEEPRRDDDLALALDRRGEVRLDGEFHVGGEEVETALAGLQQDARQHGQSAARGDAAREDAELVDQRRAITRELHPGSL